MFKIHHLKKAAEEGSREALVELVSFYHEHHRSDKESFYQDKLSLLDCERARDARIAEIKADSVLRKKANQGDYESAYLFAISPDAYALDKKLGYLRLAYFRLALRNPHPSYPDAYSAVYEADYKGKDPAKEFAFVKAMALKGYKEAQEDYQRIQMDRSSPYFSEVVLFDYWDLHLTYGEWTAEHFKYYYSNKKTEDVAFVYAEGIADEDCENKDIDFFVKAMAAGLLLRGTSRKPAEPVKAFHLLNTLGASLSNKDPKLGDKIRSCAEKLGLCYFYGKGCEKSYVQAFYWLNKAYEETNPAYGTHLAEGNYAYAQLLKAGYYRAFPKTFPMSQNEVQKRYHEVLALAADRDGYAAEAAFLSFSKNARSLSAEDQKRVLRCQEALSKALKAKQSGKLTFARSSVLMFQKEKIAEDVRALGRLQEENSDHFSQESLAFAERSAQQATSQAEEAGRSAQEAAERSAQQASSQAQEAGRLAQEAAERAAQDNGSAIAPFATTPEPSSTMDNTPLNSGNDMVTPFAGDTSYQEGMSNYDAGSANDNFNATSNDFANTNNDCSNSNNDCSSFNNDCGSSSSDFGSSSNDCGSSFPDTNNDWNNNNGGFGF